MNEATPTKQHSPCLVVKIEKPGNNQSPGFVITVGKRAVSRAVDRNLLKRRIRAALRELDSRTCLPVGREKLRIRIMALPAAKTATYQEIKSALDRELRKLKTNN